MSIKRAVENAELASKTQVNGSWILAKHVGLAIAWAVIEIAETMRDKSMDKGKVMVTEKFPAGVTVFEEEDEDNSE